MKDLKKDSNTIEDKWKGSTGDPKYVLGANSSNVSGATHECVLSPDLFSPYSEIIMGNLKGHPGIKMKGHNINNLRYADDTVLIAENKEALQ